MIATGHGYGAAWLAIWMLFHPYRPLKFLGVTVWPQGMIPRHRERLAQSIGNAVGNELVSQETVLNALFGTSFFQRKVEDFVNAYTADLLATIYPSFIEALPSGARAPILDTISALQFRLLNTLPRCSRAKKLPWPSRVSWIARQMSCYPAGLTTH